MTTQADGVYDRSRPWQSNEERLAGDALTSAALGTPRDQLANARPWRPRQGPLLPPRFGYGPKTAIGVADLVDLDTYYPGARVDYSQNQSGYQATSTPVLGVM